MREFVEDDQYSTTRKTWRTSSITGCHINRFKQIRTVLRSALKYQHKDKIPGQIVTSDKKLIYFNNTNRKRGWSAPSEPVGSVTKRSLTNKKIALCIWWDYHGIIHIKHLEESKTISSEVYSEILVCVDTAVKEKRRNKFHRRKVKFHQSNTRLHVSVFTDWSLYGLEWNLLSHPPSSPYIAPSDIHIFSHLQLHLAGAISNSTQNVRNKVSLFLDSRLPTFLSEGFERKPNFDRKS